MIYMWMVSCSCFFVCRDAISTKSGNCEGGWGNYEGEWSFCSYHCHFRWHPMHRCLCLPFKMMERLWVKTILILLPRNGLAWTLVLLPASMVSCSSVTNQSNKLSILVWMTKRISCGLCCRSLVLPWSLRRKISWASNWWSVWCRHGSQLALLFLKWWSFTHPSCNGLEIWCWEVVRGPTWLSICNYHQELWSWMSSHALRV